MRVLGIDTSGYANSIGIIDGEQVLSDFTFEARNDSLEKIITHIDSVLKSANLTLGDVQGFGIGLGPGSWTGIRIGVTVGKILAHSTGKPVAGIPTLEVLAGNANNPSALVCPVISAGPKDMVYAAFYRVNNGVISREGEYYVGDSKGLLQMVKEPTVFVGSEASRLVGQSPGSSHILIEAVEGTPKGSMVASLAVARLQRGDSDDPLSLTPLYLKESTARAFQNKYVPVSDGEK